MAWGRVNEVEQSCFRSGVYRIKGPALLKYAPAREFAEGCHDYEELCKYRQFCQAKGIPSKRTLETNKQEGSLIMQIFELGKKCITQLT